MELKKYVAGAFSLVLLSNVSVNAFDLKQNVEANKAVYSIGAAAVGGLGAGLIGGYAVKTCKNSRDAKAAFEAIKKEEKAKSLVANYDAAEKALKEIKKDTKKEEVDALKKAVTIAKLELNKFALQLEIDKLNAPKEEPKKDDKAVEGEQKTTTPETPVVTPEVTATPEVK